VHLYVQSQIKYRSGKLEPFAEVLLGGAHSNSCANACNKNTGECGSKSLMSNNAFALAIGRGVDLAVQRQVRDPVGGRGFMS